MVHIVAVITKEISILTPATETKKNNKTSYTLEKINKAL